MKSFLARIYRVDRRWYWQLFTRQNKLLAASLAGFQNRGAVVTNLFLVTGIEFADATVFWDKGEDVKGVVVRVVGKEKD